MLVDYLRVFITGGVICALVQLLMEKTKMMPGRIRYFWYAQAPFLACWEFISLSLISGRPEQRCRFLVLGITCGRG